VEGRRLLKIEHEIVRQERERQEMAAVSGKWKAKKAREEEANAKDFYSGNFPASKTYFHPTQERPKQQRLHTSIGSRHRYISHSRPSHQSQPRRS
jgi:hypothetical protein